MLHYQTLGKWKLKWQWDTTTHLVGWLKWKIATAVHVKCWWGCRTTRNLSAARGKAKWSGHLGGPLAVPTKLNMRLLWQNNPTPRYLPKRNEDLNTDRQKNKRATSVGIYTAVLSIFFKNRKYAKCSLTGETNDGIAI